MHKLISQNKDESDVALHCSDGRRRLPYRRAQAQVVRTQPLGKGTRQGTELLAPLILTTSDRERARTSSLKIIN